MMVRPFLVAMSAICLVAGCRQPKSAETPRDKVVIEGAGATFPAPLYNKWIQQYTAEHPQVLIEYDEIGSGEGTTRFLAEEVDFAASDAALTDQQINQVARGVQLVPATAGCIAIVYNIDGISKPLHLPRDVYANIFLGKIEFWNDPRIQLANLHVELPKLAIAVVARQDRSGTTYAFTNHLSQISKQWAEGPGTGKAIDWPGGAMLALGNEGVAARVSRVPGAIGYVEFGLAERLGLAMASLENKTGNFVAPSSEAGMETLKNAPLPENLRIFFPDPEGESSYPIATYSWLLLYKDYTASPAVGNELKKFVRWCLTEGQRFSEDLGYIRLAPEVTKLGVVAVEAIRSSNRNDRLDRNVGRQRLN